MPKIIQLVDSRTVGGIETHIFNLCLALQKRGMETEIWFVKNHGPHPLEEKFLSHHIAYRKLNGSSDVWRLLKKTAPSLVHTHGYKAGITGRVFSFLLRIPVVSTFHSGDDGRGKLWLYSKVDQLTCFLGQSISVSEEIARRLPGKTQLISNFVSLPPYQEKRWNNQLAFVGRLSDEKGPDQFCEISVGLEQFKRIIYGDGPMSETLKKQYASRIHFAGYVKDIASRWDEIDLLCITSRKEGLPLVAIEAMSRGVVVIAFNVGGLPSLIRNGQNGFIVPAGDKTAFSTAISNFYKLDKRDKARLSRAAYNTVIAHYSEDVIVPAIQSVYAKAVLHLA